GRGAAEHHGRTGGGLRRRRRGVRRRQPGSRRRPRYPPAAAAGEADALRPPHAQPARDRGPGPRSRRRSPGGGRGVAGGGGHLLPSRCRASRLALERRERAAGSPPRRRAGGRGTASRPSARRRMIGPAVDLGAAPRILLIRLSAIGDVVVTTPVTRALRAAFPRAYVAWVVEPKSAAALEGNPFLDEAI